MKVTSPPVATWLLQCCGADEALIGDLVEQYGRRRSSLWYWQETLVAMFLCCGRTIVNHKWLALRAIFTGWLVWFIWDVMLPRSLERLALGGGTLASHVWTMYANGAVTLVSQAGWVANGWIIGRLHRPYQAAMVLVYGGFSLIIGLPIVLRPVVAVAGYPRHDPTPGGIVLAIVSLLVGGLLSAHRLPRSVKHSTGSSSSADRAVL
jgi:hypothetical protein